MTDKLTPNQRAIVQVVWDYRVKNGDWPREKWCLLYLLEKGINLKKERLPVIKEKSGPKNTQAEYLLLNATIALQLDAGRELLSPMPTLLRLAAQRFVENHPFSDDREAKRPTLEAGDILEAWPDGEQRRLASDLLWHGSPFHLDGFSLTADGPSSIQIGRRVLAYEHAETLDECLARSAFASRISVGMFPSGKHHLLLDAVYAHVLATGEWPQCLPFAIAHRDWGDVAVLIEELRNGQPFFIRDDFGEGKYNRIRLSTAALPLVDRSGQVQNLIPKIARIAATLYRKSDADDVAIPEEELQTSLGMTHNQLAPALLFIENDYRWVSGGGNISGDKIPWHFRVDHGVLKVEHATTYNELREACEPPDSNDYPTNLSLHRLLGDEADEQDNATRSESIADTVKPRLRFMRNGQYRKMAEADLDDLDRTIGAKATKPALIALGSVLEALLLDVLERNEPRTKSHLGNHTLGNVALSQLISIAAKEDLVGGSLAKASVEFIKEHRDLVHPYRATRSKTPLGPHLISLGIQCLLTVVHSLELAASDGRMREFEIATIEARRGETSTPS